MRIMDKKILLSVRKPARYINNEINSIKKDLSKVDLKFALCFPDIYEIGMSNLGINILYGLLNERENIACERVFAPWLDYEEALKASNKPLISLENSLPLNKFDVVGFSLQYELCHTNVLNMLDLGGMKLYAKERSQSDPIIIGGGPICYNPEPVADFFDLFLIGDGEEAIIEIFDKIVELKKKGASKSKILEELTAIQGVYVPSLFDVIYNDDGTINEIIPKKDGYSSVSKRIVKDIDKTFYPSKQIVPFVKPVHDRLNIELARGCIRGCRFCHAGYVYRPYRERSCESIMDTIQTGLANTGYEEFSLLSLSAGDFSFLSPLLSTLMARHCDDRIAVSLPSIRPGTTDESVYTEIKKTRKTGFTLAPEAGSERMRRVINKDISEEELLKTADTLFKLGWKSIKLYFMVGLPYETMEDVSEIVRLARMVKDAGRKYKINAKINVSVSNFTPKGHTPFQFAKQDTEKSLKDKQIFLREELKKAKLDFKWHDTRISQLEGVFARGDRRLGALIHKAWELGSKFDEWSEVFDYSIWLRAFEECGIDMDFYLRERNIDEVFPYDHIKVGVDREFLIKEYESAREGVFSPPCNDKCRKCGVCGGDVKVVSNKTFAPPPESAPRAQSESVVKKKMRFEYTKLDEASLISHLDMQLMFIRALSRAGIKCDFTQGFHPMPKLSFGSAIPLGLNSVSEFAEADILNNISASEFFDMMNKELPNGLKIRDVWEASFKDDSLFQSITAVGYEVNLDSIEELAGNAARVQGALDNYFASKSVMFARERKGTIKNFNVKLFVKSLDHDPVSGKLNVILKRSEKGEISIFNLLEILFNLKKDDIMHVEILKTKSFFNNEEDKCQTN